MRLIRWLVLPLWFGTRVLAADAVPAAEQTGQTLARARAAYESWQYAEALTLFRSLAKDSAALGAGAETSVRIADCLFHLRRYGEAMDAYLETIKDHPAASARYFPRVKLADCLVKMNRLDDARRLYAAAVKVHGDALPDFSITARIDWLTGK